MAAYSWVQIVKKVFDLLPDKTDVDLAERFGVTRQTIATWRKEINKEPGTIKIPEWSSIESVAKGLLQAVRNGEIIPNTIDDMALVAWANQIASKRTYFSISNLVTIASLFKSENKDKSAWKQTSLGSGLGASLGSTAFLMGSTLGPLGLAIGAAVGAVTGFYLSKEMQKQNTKLKQELEQQMQSIGNDYSEGLLELAEGILEAEKKFNNNKKDWVKSLEKIISANKDATSRIDKSILISISKNIDELPSPLKMFDLDADTTREIVLDLRKSNN